MLAAEAPANDPAKAADTKSVTRPAQIEPMVGPVKRSEPQVPENKAKARDKTSDTKSKDSKASKVKAGKSDVKKAEVKKAAVKNKPKTVKKSSNRIAAKKAH